MSHRILVIDHHPQGLQRVVEPLREAGYEVAVAQTVADGASVFGRFEPQLVFIAARLPRTHGTVLCRELKRTDAGADTPIVLVVEGTGVQIDLPPLDQFGADRLIQKPVSPDELLAVCRELLHGETTLDGEHGDPPAETTPDRPDDGLSIALEELDSLDFDLPDIAFSNPTETPPPERSVPVSNDGGEDIEDHLEDLFTETSKPAPPPTVKPRPSTGKDNDADAAVIDELELESELEQADERTAPASRTASPTPARRATDAPGRKQSPHRPARSTPQASKPAAPAPGTTATVSAPAIESGYTAGRFQTEVFTRNRDVPQPFPAVAGANPVRGLARWAWVAIPLTVAIVFLAAIFMNRPQTTPQEHRPTSPGVAGQAASPGDAKTAGVPFGFPDNAEDPTDPPVGTIEAWVDQEPPADEPPATKTVAQAPALPAAREPQIETRRPPVEPEPVVSKPEPAASEREAKVEEQPAEPEPAAVEQAPVENDPEPEPAAVEQAPVENDPEPEPAAVEQAPVENDPEPEPVSPAAQPEPELAAPEARPLAPAAELEPVSRPESQTPEPEILEPEPRAPAIPEPRVEAPAGISREPILVQRVEPDYTKKDLKKGGGSVMLKIRVSEQGNVTRVLIEKGLPGSPLEAAAVAAVLRWRYEPALEDGRPVESWTSAEFTF